MGPHGKAPELVYEFTYRAQIKPPLDVGAGPFGHRMIFEVTGGEVEGERLNGIIGSGGGEWFLAGADGFGRIDVRFQLTTDDGAHLEVLAHEGDDSKVIVDQLIGLVGPEAD